MAITRTGFCYQKGEKPKSKWEKKDFLDAYDVVVSKYGEAELERADLERLSVDCLREIFLLLKREVNNGYKNIRFYSIDDYSLFKMSSSQLKIFVAEHKAKEKAKKDSKSKTVEIKCLCQFYEYPSDYKFNPNVAPIVKREVGILKGGWFYRENGTKKKTTSRGFRFIKEVE